MATFSLAKVGRWFLDSGIQNAAGGVARYYDAATGKYRAVSTEITGYTASAHIYLHHATGRAEYLDRAILTAHFLANHAWDEPLQTFPFEHPSPSSEIDHHAYFFDCGIIIRGLLAVWRCTKEDRLLEIALAASRGMVRDFHSGQDYHPVLELPEKRAPGRDDRWSRSSGCYQLKAALAWWEVAEVTGDAKLRAAFEEMLAASLESYNRFLPGASGKQSVMDRLHSFGYFLEGLSAVADRPECRDAYIDGIGMVQHYLHAISPEFVRADVLAQILRARLNAALLGVCDLDVEAATECAISLSAFQMTCNDKRVDGGFIFGRRDGELAMHVNPWVGAFALQALDQWERWQAGAVEACPKLLI